MSASYPAVMLDLETCGSNPCAPILSIGAIAFDPMSNEPLSTLPSFYVNVDIDSCLKVGLLADGATIMWWLAQSEAARKALADPPPIPIQQALAEFASWFEAQGAEDLWAHATFDPVVFRSAADACGRGLPWKYSRTRDIRTLKDLASRLGIPLDAACDPGTPHRADDDARFQAAYVRAMYQSLLGGVRLDAKQGAALSSLLGQYQDLLESAIECELIATDEGKVDPVRDPEICRRLQRDRRRWKKCEAMQTLLVPETCEHCANALAERRALPYDAMGSAPAIACTKCKATP